MTHSLEKLQENIIRKKRKHRTYPAHKYLYADSLTKVTGMVSVCTLEKYFSNRNVSSVLVKENSSHYYQRSLQFINMRVYETFPE